MPSKINLDKSDLSVSIGAKLRQSLIEACKYDERSLSDATKEAIKRWLAARDRKSSREKSKCELKQRDV
jgi:hypothetical protein